MNGNSGDFNGSMSSHKTLHDEPYMAVGPSRFSGLEIPAFAPQGDHMYDMSEGMGDMYSFDAWHASHQEALRTQATSQGGETLNSSVNPSSPVGLPPQAFQLASPRTTLAPSTGAGNIKSPERSGSEGSSEDSKLVISAPQNPTLPPSNKENESTAGQSKPHIVKNASRAQSPRTRKRRRREISNGPESVAGPSHAPARLGQTVKGTSGRVRRKNDQLEQRVAPTYQRCGILGCNEGLGATTKLANKHIRAHYDQAAALSAGKVAEYEGTTSDAAGPSAAGLSTSEQARSGARSDEEEEDRLAPRATRWQGPFPCWFQDSATSQKCCDITGEEYSDVCGLQRHCRKTHHQWYFKCSTCHQQFERRDEYRVHLALAQCG
ncbi:hypothetical protein BD413DRAFT_616048 [Trametes elegans]|nr:hypothetical protein BD413DRAFT_616048 [Trametes elegans]